MERGSCVEYPLLVFFIIRGFQHRTRRDTRNRLRERRCDGGTAMITVGIASQLTTIRNDVPSGCSCRCRTSVGLTGGRESIAELMCVTLIWVLGFLAIAELVTLDRFGFHRWSRVGFLRVLILVVELVDLMRASVKGFAIRAEVRETRPIMKTTANINISERILRLKAVTHIVHGRCK